MKFSRKIRYNGENGLYHRTASCSFSRKIGAPIICYLNCTETLVVAIMIEKSESVWNFEWKFFELKKKAHQNPKKTVSGVYSICFRQFYSEIFVRSDSNKEGTVIYVRKKSQKVPV